MATDRAFILDLGRAVRKAAKDSLQVSLRTMNQVRAFT